MKRILAISDIHGCLDLLNALLEKANYEPTNDQLIFLGDYIDRGNKSCEVVQKVKELVGKGAIALKGNHELMAINSCDGSSNSMMVWLYNGGRETLESYALSGKVINDDIGFFKSLPNYHETDDYIFVHAGLDPDCPLPEECKPSDLLWIRDEWLNSDYSGKPVIFGHTPMEDIQIWPNGKKIAIDTGAVFDNKLTCLELPSTKVYQVGREI